VEIGQQPLSLFLVLNLQPLPHKILFSLVEVRLKQQYMIKWIFTTLNGSWSTATLSQPCYALAATSVGNLVLFGGGYTPYPSKVVDVFDVTSNTWTTATLSVGRHNLATTSLKDLVFFGGGWIGSSYTNVIDVYNVTNGMWRTLTLSESRGGLTSTSLNDLVFFAGGETSIFLSNSFKSD
jgi:hypothetical protein